MRGQILSLEDSNQNYSTTQQSCLPGIKFVEFKERKNYYFKCVKLKAVSFRPWSLKSCHRPHDPDHSKVVFAPPPPSLPPPPPSLAHLEALVQNINSKPEEPLVLQCRQPSPLPPTLPSSRQSTVSGDHWFIGSLKVLPLRVKSLLFRKLPTCARSCASLPSEQHWGFPSDILLKEILPNISAHVLRIFVICREI